MLYSQAKAIVKAEYLLSDDQLNNTLTVGREFTTRQSQGEVSVPDFQVSLGLILSDRLFYLTAPHVTVNNYWSNVIN